MKAVLISIQPKWCELIASGKKTVEVRKTRPKLKTPFKCYIYCTEKDYDKIFCIDKFMHKVFLDGNGKQKVIGEFVCDRFTFFDAYYDTNGNRNLCNTAFVKSCVPYDELFDYLYGKHGKKHGGWAWHISDLVIYGEPKELSEFSKYGFGEPVPLKRPPQSWMYVESEDAE